MKDKMCPIASLFTNVVPRNCMTEDCAWWNAEAGACAVLALSIRKVEPVVAVQEDVAPPAVDEPDTAPPPLKKQRLTRDLVKGLTILYPTATEFRVERGLVLANFYNSPSGRTPKGGKRWVSLGEVDLLTETIRTEKEEGK